MVFAIPWAFLTPSPGGLLARRGVHSVPHSQRSGGRTGPHRLCRARVFNLSASRSGLW